MAKRIPQNKVDEIYAALDIVEVVGDFVQLKKRGSNFFGLSPWSNEKTPSFAVSATKGIFKDFSSGRGGSAVTFLMELEGMTYVEALEYLAKKYSIDLEYEETEESKEARSLRESLLVLNNFATKWFHQQLMESERGKRIGLSYFKERGLIQKTIDDFQLGISPDEWEAFKDEALKNQYTEEVLLASGLVGKSDKSDRLYDRFKGRLMFPIQDHMGKVIGFGGRIIGKQEGVAKYINSPETEVYHKSRVLYGISQAKQTIRDEDRAILVEGYMDVISLHQAGIRNAVAASGTALTEDQIRLIGRFSKNVLIIFDADAAGIKAALRGIELLLQKEMKVKVLLLPEGDDPDSYVKKNGKSGFDEFVEKEAQDFLAFRVQQLKKSLDPSDPTQRAELIHQTASTVSLIPDPVQQAIYLEFAAQLLETDQSILENALGSAMRDKAQLEKREERIKQRQTKQEEEKQATATVEGKARFQELEVLRLLINHWKHIFEIEEQSVPLPDLVKAELEGLSFEDPLLQAILDKMFDQWNANSRIDTDPFLHQEDPETAKIVASLITIPYEVSKNWERFDIRAPEPDEDLEESVADALSYFKLFKVKRLIEENMERMKKVENEEEMHELAKVHTYLLNMRREIEDKKGIGGGIDANVTRF